MGDNAGLTIAARVLLVQALSRYGSNVKAQASFKTGVHGLGLFYLNFVEWTLVSEFILLHGFPTLTQTNSAVDKEVCMCASHTLDHDNKKPAPVGLSFLSDYLTGMGPRANRRPRRSEPPCHASTSHGF